MKTAQKKTLWQLVKENAVSFMDTVKSGPDFLLCILIACYLVSEYVENINWTNELFYPTRMNFFHYIVLFGSGAYLCYKAAMWKKLYDNPLILIPFILAVGCLCGLFMLFLVNRWVSNKIVFTVVTEIFLCLMAYGKDYKKLLRWIVFIPIATLVIAGVGLLAGFTEDFAKMGQSETTRSLGIIYPNTWGHTAFQAMLLVWYLYLKRKPLLTFAMFWGVGVFLYFVIGCRTIAALSMVFPPITLLTDWMEGRARNPGKKPGPFGWAAIALPILCFALSIGLCLAKEWVAVTFYPTKLHRSAPFHTAAMRFVQGGLALEYFGFPLFGRQMILETKVYLDSSTGISEYLFVMDNAFATFIILKGMLWMILCLAWMTFGQWRGWKKQDYSVMLISCFMVIFAIMERPGLEMWYNFALLYPLASFADSNAKPAVSVRKK